MACMRQHLYKQTKISPIFNCVTPQSVARSPVMIHCFMLCTDVYSPNKSFDMHTALSAIRSPQLFE